MAQFGIQRGGGLVEQHQLGLDGQRPGNGHALLLAARQLRRIVVHAFAQPHLVQQPLGQLARFAPVLTARMHRAEHDVLQRGHLRKQVELLEHHAGLAADLAHLGGIALHA
ncbi:hypothetical protein G6F31_020066 [Rhizopus arrhizus]|nr:hypothetical protein G6F31_020066 [Rhizopus arrhizus]